MARTKGIVAQLAEKYGVPAKFVKSMIMRYGIARAKKYYKEMLDGGAPRSRQTWYKALSMGLRDAWDEARKGVIPGYEGTEAYRPAFLPFIHGQGD